MINFEKLFPQNLYHSYVIEGESEKIATELIDFLEARGEIQSQSPDVLSQTYESFTMDDSREIKDWHSRLGITEGKKICILTTKFINREAEQTLLKIIEEPASNTHFFIIIPDSSVLLPTIISRVHIIKTPARPHNSLGAGGEISNNQDIKKEVSNFLKSTKQERINILTKIIKDNKSEDNSGQLRFYATQFVNEIENIYYQKFKKDKNNKEIQFVLNELQKARVYLSTPGASVKMILEHLALVI